MDEFFYRASLANAQARLQAVENLPVPTVVRPDLPIRRQQASIAVCIAEAQLCQTEWETLSNVTRTFGVSTTPRSKTRGYGADLRERVGHPRCPGPFRLPG
jgi:hypothetical protein